MYPKEIKSTKDRLDYAVAMGKKIKEEEEKKKKDTLYQQAYKELSQPKQTIQPTQDEYQQAYNEVFMEYSNPEKTRRDYIPTLNTTSDKQVNNVGDALSHLGQKAIYGLAGGVSNITGGIAKTLGNPGTAIDAVLDIPESFHNAFLKNTYKVMDKENPGYYDDLSEKDKIKHDSLFNQTKTENFLDRNIDQYDDFMNWLDNNPVSNVLDSVGDGYLNSNNYFRSNYNEEDMNKILKFGGDIVQGATNMIPSITVGALTGNPSLAMGTMGVNAYGGGLHQALSEGADLENAYRYGLANALTEVATESLVGGIPALGGGYADDLITKVTDKAFKTPTAKNIANKGLDLLGEGLEEYLGDIIGEFTTDIYSNEKQYEDPMQRLKDTQADALYSGLVGIGTAGLLNAPGYISEVNANRQNNASTDTIQSNILENNTLAKEPVNSEIEQAVTELEEEFYQLKQYELTQEQLDNSPFSLEELQSDGSEIIITKNELLNDNALIRDNAQKVNTQNIEIQLENSNYDKQTVATLSKLSNEYGIPLKFESLPNHINGMYHNGEIIINKNSSEPLMTVFTHELTHSLESTQTYNELVGAVVEHLNMTSDISDLNTVIDEEVYRVIQERAELGINLNYDQAHKEVIAEYISEYIADDSFINSISSNKSIVQRIVDWLKNIVTSLTGSKEQKAYKGLLNKYQKALTQVDYQPNNGIENIQAAAPFSINGDVITLQDGAKYSINKSFSDIVTEIQKNTYNNDGTNAIEVRPNTPDVLKNIGFSDLPMLITLNHTKNAMGIGNSGNQHNIDVSILKNLPNLLEDPIMIYKKDGKINMLLKSTDLNSNTMLVVIKPNGKGNYNNLEIDTNFILTAFGKEGIIRYFDKVVKQSDILYPENTTKKEVLSETLRHQLSNHNTIPRNQIISNNTKKSTPQYSINPTNNSDIRFSPKKEIKNNIITLNKEIPGLREKLINNSNKYLGYESTEFKNLLKNGARDILETGNITESSRNSIYDYIENNSKIGLTQDINNFVSEIKATIDNKKALIKRANKDENIIEKTTDKVHKILKTGKDLETKYSKDMERYVNEYGAIKKGEMPARDIKVPKETDKGTVKQHYRTILESPQASIEVIEALQGEIENGNATYKPISNETLVNNSKNTDAQIGSKNMYDEFMKNDKISAQAISDGEYLLNKAMRNNDIEQTINLSQKLASMLNETGRALQSARILKRLTPEGQLTILQKEVIKINNEIETKFKNKKPVKISEELVKKFTEADTVEGKKEVLTEMQKNVGEQIPSSLADKMNQWRYLSMLGNPRTHIRNIVGNTVFQPIVGAKNIIGTIIEGTISKTGLIKDLERSKAILNPLSKQDKALIKWANDDFKNVKDSFEKTGKYEINKEIQSNKKVFESKIVGETLNKLSDWNSTMLDYEDEVFTKYRYSRTLAEQFKANKITPETVDGDTLVKFQDKAYKEALESVYRDANGLASAINKFRYTNKGTRFIADAIMPFTKTPMNIVKRMVEYSPVGLVKDITYGVYEVQQGKISADTYINNLSKGLTGSGIAMLGYFLASIGMFRTNDDDKYRLNAFERDLGEQNYALVLPNGDTYTLDWMSPVIGPLGIGAELYRYIEDKSNTKNIGEIFDSLAGVLDPIMQTSMLSGLANSLSSYDENKISGVFKSAVYSYVGQFFPTFGGQLARVFDDKRRTTYSNNSLERQVKIIMNKIPGVATLNEPYINKKGQEEYTGNILERVFNNMISPGYYKRNTADKYDEELIRLFNLNPESNNNVIPTSYSKFSYNKETHKFTPKESTQTNKLYGTTVRKEVSKFIDSPVYKNLSDSERVDIISKLQDYAVQMTRADYFNNDSVADRHVGYANYFKKNGYDVYSYYINKSIPSVIDENGETIRNSKAILTRYNLERLGIYDKIVNDYQNGRIDDEDLSYFNLNKTVINMETYKYYNQFEELYQSKDVEKILSDFDIFESTVTKYKK